MNKKNRISLVIVSIVWLTLAAACVVIPKNDISISERRKLAQFPSITLNAITSGSFMEQFESYAMDQFPLRDQLRTLKSITTLYGFGQKDSNGYYVVDGYVEKINYPLDDDSITNALERMQNLYDSYLTDAENIYLSVIPDKGYFIAEANGYPAIDYEELFQKMKIGASYSEYVDITDALDITSYYKTDTHWRQEQLHEVADVLQNALGSSQSDSEEYVVQEALDEFYGVYQGQSAMPLQAEPLNYVTNDRLDSCIVTNLEDNSVGGIYNQDKLDSKDPYEFFLSGSTPIITIDNPNAQSEKELVLFRDSFGSSLAPLLVEGYSKITLVDIRYMDSKLLGEYVEFTGTDVLFLYSTLLLNSSYTMK